MFYLIFKKKFDKNNENEDKRGCKYHKSSEISESKKIMPRHELLKNVKNLESKIDLIYANCLMWLKCIHNF